MHEDKAGTRGRAVRIALTLMTGVVLVAILSPARAAAQALPTGWTLTNVGGPAAAGSASFADGVFTVSGAGTGVVGRDDQFAFVHRPMTGDGLIIVRLSGFQGWHPKARAGVMIRESLAAGSKHAFLDLVGSNNYLELLRRTTTDARVVSIAEAAVAAPLWLKLERHASTVVASRSTDGITWTYVGETFVTTTSTIYAGLAVTNRSPEGQVTTSFSNVDVRSLSGNQPPAVSLSSPVSGASYLAPASIALSANASDPDGTIAQVSFYAGNTLLGSDTAVPYSYTWNGVAAGSYVVTAVARDQAGLQTTSASVTVNVTSAPSNQPPTVSLTAPIAGATYTAPASVTVAANAADTDGTVARVDFYAGSTLIGSDTSSPYSVAWSSVPAGSYSISAIARDNAGASTTSAPRAISVSSNQPPSVSLTAPAGGATFTAPANVTVSANAADADGTIARVDFYSGSVLIGSDATSPYSIVWSGVSLGSYSITAVARDNVGASTTTLARAITVVSNQSPSVSLTAPVSGSTYTAPASITLTANASDPDGTVARVDFYSGSTLLGSDTTSPFSITWSAGAGQYSLTAVARDNAGAMTVSSASSIIVNNPQIPGHALFVPSANDTSVSRYVVEIFPNGSDPSISNPVAIQDVGKPPIVNGECLADISQTVTALTPGTYIATVTAVGSTGSTRSAPSLPFTR